MGYCFGHLLVLEDCRSWGVEARGIEGEIASSTPVAGRDGHIKIERWRLSASPKIEIRSCTDADIILASRVSNFIDRYVWINSTVVDIEVILQLAQVAGIQFSLDSDIGMLEIEFESRIIYALGIV